MKRIESFNQNQLEENFFLMTGLLMTGLFDFLSYAIGIGGTRWKIFTPALLISLLISDSILVAVGAGVSQGAGLFLGIALLGMFALATISGLAKRRIPKIRQELIILNPSIKDITFLQKTTFKNDYSCKNIILLILKFLDDSI